MLQSGQLAGNLRFLRGDYLRVFRQCNRAPMSTITTITAIVIYMAVYIQGAGEPPNPNILFSFGCYARRRGRPSGSIRQSGTRGKGGRRRAGKCGGYYYVNLTRYYNGHHHGRLLASQIDDPVRGGG